ncbi:MAG: DUF488 domain-containing protein [Gammaproteobacteria bacterium]|nr:DUF488 domain-containing protein [Gammaproteobacteria bacterium]
MSQCESAVFTIGHSNHSQEALWDLLASHRVDVLADVRSAPYSRFNPQFNRETLAARLKAGGIEYVYLGTELGGRPTDSACYENGRVCYARVAETPAFRHGLAEVMDLSGEHRVALMCAEKEPLDCHRTLLVAQALDARSVNVHHILADGAIETHADAISRLLQQYDLNPDGDMLTSREEAISLAIGRQAREVAFAEQAPRAAGREVP